MLVSLVSFMNAVARTGALFNVIPVLAQDRLSLSTDRIGLGLALASLVGLAVVYPSGVLVDRYGRKFVIVPATFVSGVSLLLFLLAPSYAWFLAGCVAWSLAVGVSGAAPAAYAADVAPPGMNAAAMSAFECWPISAMSWDQSRWAWPPTSSAPTQPRRHGPAAGRHRPALRSLRPRIAPAGRATSARSPRSRPSLGASPG